MGCSTCAVSKSGTPTGCGNKGHCNSGSCNKMNAFDWLAMDDYVDPTAYPLVEVSFKKGARKDFFHLSNDVQCVTGDMVVVEASNGHDLGRVTLSGELVRLQMKKKRTNESRVKFKVLRTANDRDLEKLTEARALEHDALVNARKLARSLGLDMKIGDVEYQGDQRKATFYYTAEGRVDFRELVRVYAREFRVKIEMRQIGSRQESARIGGIGSCGRELCCSTWLSDFQSVNTTAARYQNIAINQTKLSGQCGRLKCCLNYELDMYVEALDNYPKHLNKLFGKTGRAEMIKIDIFKKLIYYSVKNDNNRFMVVALTKEQAEEIYKANKNGNKDLNIINLQHVAVQVEDEEEHEFADVTGEIELPDVKKKKRNNRNKKRRKPNQSKSNTEQKSNNADSRTDSKSEKSDKPKANRSRNKRRNNNRNKPTDKKES